MSNEDKHVFLENNHNWPPGAVRQIEELQRQVEMWRQLYLAELARERTIPIVVWTETGRGFGVVTTASDSITGKIKHDFYPPLTPSGTM